MKEKVFAFLLTIPRGKVVTYAQVARAVGRGGAARAVGNLLHKNPDGDLYPCYKVVNSRGCLSQHYAFGGIEQQKERLQKDGIEVTHYKVDLEKYRWKEL